MSTVGHRAARRSVPGLLLAAGTVLAATVILSAQVLPPAPSLVIESPVDGSIFYSKVELKGRVSAAPASSVQSLKWSIEGTDRGEPLDPAADGSFQAQIPLDGLHSNLTLMVTAVMDGKTFQASVGLVDRRAGPSVYIQSPRRNVTYGSSVRVTGQVLGPVELEDPLAEVASLSWSVPGSTLGGPLRYGPDGAFDFSFSTVGLHGPVEVRVLGTDRNGHQSVSTLPLSDRPSGPSLKVETPAEKASYGAAVSVSGRVGDPADPSGSPAEVKTLSWQLLGDPAHSGTAPWQRDGTFAFSFPTQGLSGTQTLELRAEDRNGRVTTVSMSLEGSPAAAPPAVAAAPVPAAPAVPLTPAPAAPPAAPAPAAPAALAPAAPAPAAPAALAPAAPAPVPTPAAPPAAAPAPAPAAPPAAAPTPAPAAPPAAAAPSPAGPPITISSPAQGGFYKDITIIEGRIGIGAGAALKSFTYRVPGHTRSGRVAVDARGAFKLPLDLSDITGDLSVVLAAEDAAGGTSEASLSLHDGRLKPTITLLEPANGGSYGSAIRVAGTVTDPYAGRAGHGRNRIGELAALAREPWAGVEPHAW